MRSRFEGYPWTDAKGLCSILRNPSIWGPIFPKSDDRQAAKRAAKRTPVIQNLPYVKVFNVTSDTVFGTVIIELLTSPTGRKELDKEFSKRFKGLQFRKSIAERIYYHHLAQYEGKIPRFDEICEKRTDKSWHFVPANLRAWLARKQISPEDQRTLSLYACYLALREPEQAEEILKVFVNHDVAFLNWLSNEDVISESSPVLRPQSLPEPAQARTQAEAQAETQDVTAIAVAPVVVLDDKRVQVEAASLPADSAELVRLLTSSSDWDRELSIDQLRSAIHLLTRKAERHANPLHDFDEIRHRVSASLEKVAQIPWLECDLSIDQYLSLPPNISVERALEHFASLEREATRLLQVHNQLKTLVSKLGGEPSPCVPREATSLKDMAACLEERAASLTEKLHDLSLREERVVEFFDRFAAADQENAQWLIENTDPSRWVDIVWFHAASSVMTGAGRRYEKLVRRFDLIGLIVAYLWHLNADKAIEIACAIVGKQQRPFTCQQLVEALAWLTLAQLQELADACTNNVSDIAKLILAAAIDPEHLEEGSNSSPLPADFDQRCAVNEAGDVVVLNARDLIQPTMIQSWPAAVIKGAVPLSYLLSDHFRQALGTAPASLREAVAEFLRRSEFRAAWDAAATDPELQQSVAEGLKNRRAAILKDYEELLIEAQNARIHDEYIDLCLTEMENAFDTFDFNQALQRLNELASLVRRFKALRDPARAALVKFLQEAKLSVQDEESLEHLRQRVDLFRDQHREQRLHLLELERAARDDRLPSSLRKAWSDFARDMDRPTFWPSEEKSRALAEAIDTFVRFIFGKLRFRDDDPPIADTLVERLDEWIRTQLRTGLAAEEPGRNAAIQALCGLAQEIKEFAPDGHVLRVVSASEPTPRLLQDSTEVVEQLPPAGVEEDREQEKETQRQAEVQYRTEESQRVEEERSRGTKAENKRLEPINRGGRSRVSPPNRERQPAQGSRTWEPKPELICWKSNWQWIPAVEVPDSFLESSKLTTFQNERSLAEDGSREGCWHLEQINGQVVVHWNDNEALREFKVTLGENNYLLFKLSGQDQNQGRLVKAPSSGSYLVMAPEDWERDEALSGLPLVVPESVSITGYRGHFFLLEKNSGKKIAFHTPGGSPVVIESRALRFELVGTRLPDASENIGPLFGCVPPKIRVLDSQRWRDVGTIVVGEEGSGRGRWRTAFPPVPGKAEQDLPSEVATRKGGWYFLRFHDVDGDLIESMDFRFVCALKEIKIPQPVPFPSEDGHRPTCVEFLHEPGCFIQPADGPGSSISIETQVNKTILSIPPGAACDKSRWFVKLEASPQVEVTILVERLWWAVEEEEAEPVTWQDKVLPLSRGDLAATSTKALWIKLPKRRWTDTINVGFTREGARAYSVKVTEETVAITLRDFGDTQITMSPGTAPLQLWIWIHEMSYTGTFCQLVIKVGCRLCNFSASTAEDVFRHIESQHLDGLLRPLTYQELQAYIPTLPPAIYKCHYCPMFVRSDDPSNPTSAITWHIERDCPNVARGREAREPVKIVFNSISDADEIRKHIITDLPHIHKCELCSDYLKEATQSDKFRHLIESHRAQLYQLQ